LARRKSKEKDPHEEESESENEVVSAPLDVLKINYPTVDEIIADLGTFFYDHVAKQITKETTRKILKEYEIDIMQLDKTIFIHNTATYLIAITTSGTTVS